MANLLERQPFAMSSRNICEMLEGKLAIGFGHQAAIKVMVRRFFGLHYKKRGNSDSIGSSSPVMKRIWLRGKLSNPMAGFLSEHRIWVRRIQKNFCSG